MRCVYQHWQHGRLVEGEVATNSGTPLEVINVWAAPLPSAMVLHRLMEQGAVIGETPCVPVVWYELTWYDGKTAYYKMANRWRG